MEKLSSETRMAIKFAMIDVAAVLNGLDENNAVQNFDRQQLISALNGLAPLVEGYRPNNLSDKVTL